MDHRLPITPLTFNQATMLLHDRLRDIQAIKGTNTFISDHEALGWFTEEYSEYLETVHKNAPASDRIDKLLNISVVAIWQIATILTTVQNEEKL